MVMYCLSSTLAFPLESTDRRGPTVVAPELLLQEAELGFGGGNTTAAAAGIILEEETQNSFWIEYIESYQTHCTFYLILIFDFC